MVGTSGLEPLTSTVSIWQGLFHCLLLLFTNGLKAFIYRSFCFFVFRFGFFYFALFFNNMVAIW